MMHSQNRLVSHDWVPHVLYIELGSNDLSTAVDPCFLAKQLVALADYFVLGHGIGTVYLGQCLRRFSSRLNNKHGLTPSKLLRYNKAVHSFNKQLELSTCPPLSGHVHYWRHRGGIWGLHSQNLFHADGVHLNNTLARRIVYIVWNMQWSMQSTIH